MQQQQTRVIKKYKNRKLYDTQESSYITLGDLITLLNENVDLQVLDSSGADITNEVVIKAIFESNLFGSFQFKELWSFLNSKKTTTENQAEQNG